MHLVSAFVAIGSLIVEALAKLTSFDFCDKLPALPDGRKEQLPLASFSTIMVHDEDDRNDKAFDYNAEDDGDDHYQH